MCGSHLTARTEEAPSRLLTCPPSVDRIILNENQGMMVGVEDEGARL